MTGVTGVRPRRRGVRARALLLLLVCALSLLCAVLSCAPGVRVAADGGGGGGADKQQHDGDEDDDLSRSGWLYLIAADTVLLLFAALFAGLTLALLGLDTLSLEIIADSGSEPDKSYARKILPIRQLGNQLLCTLILGNVMVNTLIAQITDAHIHGWIATAVSTALTTLGGEVIPQALMSAHALRVGSQSAPLVRLFVVLFYPVCKPLSIILDRFIGSDPGQIYERNELKKLMVMHAARSAETGIGEGEVDLMVGAMELHEKTVREVMTPISEVFMLEANEHLNEELIQLISERGHSRIPVYQSNKNNIIGVLFAKDLLMANPQEDTRVMLLVKFYNRRCHIVAADTKLISMLKYFQTGKSHMALVQEVQQRAYGDPYYEIKGLVTMEDVIEELIQSEIFDEYDLAPRAHGATPMTTAAAAMAAAATSAAAAAAAAAASSSAAAAAAATGDDNHHHNSSSSNSVGHIVALTSSDGDKHAYATTTTAQQQQQQPQRMTTTTYTFGNNGSMAVMVGGVAATVPTTTTGMSHALPGVFGVAAGGGGNNATVLKRQIGITARCARRVHLNHNELKASALFLCESLPALCMQDVSTLMQALTTYTTVYRVRAPGDARGLDMDDKQNVWLYREGTPSSIFTLVIAGRVEVFAGKDAITLELGSWSTIAMDALRDKLFLPTFSCRVVQDSTLMQITRDAYMSILAMLHAAATAVSVASERTHLSHSSLSLGDGKDTT